MASNLFIGQSSNYGNNAMHFSSATDFIPVGTQSVTFSAIFTRDTVDAGSAVEHL